MAAKVALFGVTPHKKASGRFRRTNSVLRIVAKSKASRNCPEGLAQLFYFTKIFFSKVPSEYFIMHIP